MKISGILSAVILLAGTALVSAQQYRPDPPAAVYRSGVPAVVTPAVQPIQDPEAPAKQELERFRRWYSASKRPAIMVFWNRELTDDTAMRTAEVSTARNEGRGETRTTGRTTGGGKDDGYKNEDKTETKFDSQIQMTEKSQRILTGGNYANLDRMSSDQFEAGFQNAWIAANVEIVDRAAMMRNLSLANKKDDRSDLQLLEAAALQQNVQYLIEILPNASNQSASGYVFRVRVLHLPSSTVVGQFLSQAMPATHSETAWVAGPSGFTKRTTTSPPPSPTEIGSQLAYETMKNFH